MPKRKHLSDTDGLNPWPGYVDALSTLLIVVIFVLFVFIIAQAYLGSAILGKNRQLALLNNEINSLSSMLSLEHKKDVSLQTSLTASLALLNTEQSLNKKLSVSLVAAQAQVKAGQTALTEQNKKLTDQQSVLQNQGQQLILLNEQIAALRSQLTAVSADLALKNAKISEQAADIQTLGNRLNIALAQKVEQLKFYRSQFFGELRQALAGEPDIRIVGDRFVLGSSVLFSSNSATLTPAGLNEIAKVARLFDKIAPKIPTSLNWVLEVDGYTDKLPIISGPYKNNWQLSVARALSVVQALIENGVPPSHLAAAGFGSNFPINPGNTQADLAQNRRIEFRLTAP